MIIYFVEHPALRNLNAFFYFVYYGKQHSFPCKNIKSKLPHLLLVAQFLLETVEHGR